VRTAPGAQAIGVDRLGQPGFDRTLRAVVTRQPEAGRHHTRDHANPAVDLDARSDNLRRAAKAALPQRVAQQDRVGSAAGL
jgi:hypothetical protein